jgi:hypothetical protein
VNFLFYCSIAAVITSSNLFFLLRPTPHGGAVEIRCEIILK